jgi:hypothetical protein
MARWMERFVPGRLCGLPASVWICELRTLRACQLCREALAGTASHRTVAAAAKTAITRVSAVVGSPPAATSPAVPSWETVDLHHSARTEELRSGQPRRSR